MRPKAVVPAIKPRPLAKTPQKSRESFADWSKLRDHQMGLAITFDLLAFQLEKELAPAKAGPVYNALYEARTLALEALG